jgi:hypothetical protein
MFETNPKPAAAIIAAPNSQCKRDHLLLGLGLSCVTAAASIAARRAEER